MTDLLDARSPAAAPTEAAAPTGSPGGTHRSVSEPYRVSSSPTAPGILRFRVAVVTLLGIVVALAAGGVFDEWRWEFVLPPLAVGAVGSLTLRRGRLLRLGGATGGLVVAAIGVALLDGGSLDDVGTAATSGVRQLLSTDWPSPVRPVLTTTVATVIGILAAIGVELARRRRLHLMPLIPIAVAHLAVVSLSAPAGTRLVWLIPLGLLATVVAVFRTDVDLGERLKLLDGERRLAPMTAIAFGLALAVSLPVALTLRADPRRNEDPERSASLLDPIEATLALQEIDPPLDLHRIRIDELDPAAVPPSVSGVPERWRTAVLANYDGRRWSPDLTLRPIGRRLDPDLAPDVSGSITFLDEELQLVPLPGPASTVDGPIETDPGRTLVRLAERPQPGDSVDFGAQIEPTGAGLVTGVVDGREIDDQVSGLTELAASIVADAAEAEGLDAPPSDLLGQLRLLETAMRDDFLLDPAANGAGQQRTLIVRFIRETRRGTAEQFATAYVLLARSLGVDARLATGFDVGRGDDRRAAADGVDARNAVDLDVDGAVATVTLTSADASVWPEVRVDDRWVGFDPVPDDEVSDLEPERDRPQVQTPAAPQPPAAPPPEATDDPFVTDDDSTTDESDGLPDVVRLVVRVAVAVGALLVPVIVFVAGVLFVKWRRRRRGLGGPPVARIRGSWSIATNRLVDAGLRIRPADTNEQIAENGSGMVPEAAPEIRRLATLASAVTFGAPARPDLLALDAASCLDRLETTMSDSRSTWQRLRWQLSVRSLLRRTRSPV